MQGSYIKLIINSRNVFSEFLPFQYALPSLLPLLFPQFLLGPHVVDPSLSLPELPLSTEVSEISNLLMHVVQLGVSQGVEEVPQLVGVDSHVVVGHHPRHVLAVEIVVGDVDVPDTPVGVVVAVGAGTERTTSPTRLRPPVLVVVTETIHLRLGLAVVSLLRLPPALLLHLLPLDLLPLQFEQLPLQPLVLSLRPDLLLQFLLGVTETGLSVVLVQHSRVSLSLTGVLARQELPDLFELFQLFPQLVHLLSD